MYVILLLGIVVAAITLPFIWLYEKVGAVFFSLIILCLIAGGIYLRRALLKRRYSELQVLALKTIRYPVVTARAKAINMWLAGKYPGWAPLIRNLQIIRDSLDIALTSKKMDIAESRMKLALDRWQESQQEYGGLLAPETADLIASVIEETHSLYHTTLYLNMAGAHLEKAQNLKTEKGRAKHRDLAKVIIQDGLDDPLSDKTKLTELLNQVDGK
ncbi:MAG: hypothetical protein GXX82_05930 [Syntrophorhabdus sp.]|nr:hypothetical protein [Syntrophorhabdus sp.]